VMALDAAGYLLAVSHVHGDAPLRVILEDTFVAVAILTISVGLILPGGSRARERGLGRREPPRNAHRG